MFNLCMDEDDPILGFAAKWVYALAKEVEDVDVITMRRGVLRHKPSNVNVFSVGKEKGYSEIRRAIEFYKILGQLLSAKPYIGCFSHMMPLFSAMGGGVLKFKNVPLVTWYAHPSLTPILKVAHFFSKYMVASVTSAYPYKKDKLVAIGQGIDTQLFCRKAEIDKQFNPPLLLCVGRISPVKNHETLIRAVKRLKDEGISLQVNIIGAIPEGHRAYAEYLYNLVKQLQLQQCVHFNAPVSYEKLVEHYNRAVLHVNLTPKGFGDKVAWEAMACECVCVASNEGYVETFGRYANDLLFEFGNAESLASKIKALITSDKGRLEEMGKYLRERVVSLHSLETLGEKIISLLTTA